MAREFAKSFYRSALWRGTRDYVLLRDVYLCQICGAPAEEVHHKIHLSPENISDPEVTVNPDNLISLCHDCHMLQHRKETQTIEGVEDMVFDENGFMVLAKPPGGG